MELCDSCILEIEENLSLETKRLLEKKILPLLKEHQPVTGKELARCLARDRTKVKQVIEELKSHLLLGYIYKRHQKYYTLTETAERYWALKQGQANPQPKTRLGVDEDEQKPESTPEASAEEEIETVDETDSDKQETTTAEESQVETSETDLVPTDDESETSETKVDSKEATSISDSEATEDEELVWDLN